MKKIDSSLEGKKEAHMIYRAVNELYNMLRHRDALPDSLETAIKEFRSELTDIVNPYPVSRLDQRLKELDKKFPDFEHGYVRTGITLTWVDRPRSPDHTFYREFGPDVRTLARVKQQAEAYRE